jgi:hypothetical protein
MPKYKSILFPVIILFLIQANIYSQDTDITNYLKQIEDGQRTQVSDKLELLKKKYPDSPSIMFLEGVLTEDGQQAVSTYTGLLNKYPKSRYADAALYRICGYYYAIGKYSYAKKYLNRLKLNYPQSPYIKLADKVLPAKDDLIEQGKSMSPEIDETQPSIELENYKYTIQAGAFTVAENAKSLEAELDSAGYYTKNEVKSVAGTSFHIVYAGKFVTLNDAEAFLKLLNKKYGLNGRIVTNNIK